MSNELEISISTENLEKIIEYKNKVKADSFGQLLVSLIESDTLIRDLQDYKESLANIAEIEETDFNQLIKQILKNFISIHWVNSDSEQTPFSTVTKHAISLTSGYNESIKSKLNKIARKESKARNYLDEIVLPLLAKASHSLKKYNFGIHISELSESHTISGNIHYKLKMNALCPSTRYCTSICFISSPHSGNMGARVRSRERTHSFKRIHMDNPNVNDYCIEAIKDFIYKAMQPS